MIFFLFLVSSAYATECEAGWSPFNKHCYKHIYDPSTYVHFAQAESECAKRGAYLTSTESPEELNFVTEIASRLGDWSSNVDAMKAFPVLEELRYFALVKHGGYDALMIQGKRDYNKKWSWPRSNSTWFYWCKPTEPTLGDNENCLNVYKTTGQPCLVDARCDPSNTFWHYVCKKPAKPVITCKAGAELKADGKCGCKQGYRDITETDCLERRDYKKGDLCVSLTYVCKKPAISCKAGAEIKTDGKCGCKNGYFDITETDCPERRGYKRGEMCISLTPCRNVTSDDSLSIVFVVDSSQSIGASNWKNMVRFLKSGSKLLDNSIDVGFVQFSTDVTYSEWLPRKWRKDDYLEKTPNNFDAGYTNTPAALEEALRLFKTDRSRHQVAVLITDGMPYVEDILPKEEAMSKTVDAAKKLRESGVALVALGYGSELQKYQSYLKEILEKPNRDYFEYDKEAGYLKEIHMTVLLNKVCNRFQ